MYGFHLQFHRILFPRVQQHYSSIGSDNDLVPSSATIHYQKQWWSVYRGLYASIGFNELILHILDWIPSDIRPRRFGILYPPIWKVHLLFSIYKYIEMTWPSLPMWLLRFMSFMRLISTYLNVVLSFIDPFYWWLTNYHVFLFYIECVFHMPHLVFTCIIPSHHFSFSGLIASGQCYSFVVCVAQIQLSWSKFILSSMHRFVWDAISNPCPKFNLGWNKPPLKLECKNNYIPQFMCMKWLVHVLI